MVTEENETGQPLAAKPARGWQANYARHRGCDRSYICRKIKDGLPFDPADPHGSFAIADRWMAENCPEGVGHKSGGRGRRDSTAKNASPAVVTPPIFSAVTGEDVATILGRARRNEELAWAALEEASRRAVQGATKTISEIDAAEIRVNAASALPGLRRNHAASARAVVDIERRVHELRIEQNEVGRFEFLRDIMVRRLRPIARQLEAIPPQWAARVNPEKPLFAQQVLEKEVAALREQIDQAWKEDIDASDSSD